VAAFDPATATPAVQDELTVLITAIVNRTDHAQDGRPGVVNGTRNRLWRSASQR
jgi:hypothetical protein